MAGMRKYATARFGVSDPLKARDVIDKLQESSKRPLTAQLMVSPLQVTFMATVIAARGDPGEDRWQLFSSYYRTIYDRERQKAVPPYDAILSRQQKTIDQLHHDIGFWLQMQNETAGTSNASLSIAAFAGVVDTYLADLGHDPTERQLLVEGITELAQQRLVFLTSRVPGELSFDVRSLQEFMAAECITSGEPELVKARLQAIAAAPYWRNVLLFAAGKCFSDAHSRHLQDSVRLLCEDLNHSSEPLFATILSGSELALDILESGVLAETPKYARLFVQTALKLIRRPYLSPDQGAPSADRRLALAYRHPLRAVFESAITLHLGQAQVEETLGAWPLVMRLKDSGVAWAEELAESRWPQGKADLEAVVLKSLPIDIRNSRTFLGKLERIVLRLPPTALEPLLTELLHGQENLDQFAILSALKVLQRPGFGRDPDFVLSDVHIPIETRNKKVEFFGLDVGEKRRAAYKVVGTASGVHKQWIPLQAAHAFVQEPSGITLADVLRSCAEAESVFSDTLPRLLPWPLAACFNNAKTAEDLLRLSELASRGELGRVQDWRKAEARWKTNGWGLPDLEVREPGLPIHESISVWGPPPFVTGAQIAHGAFHPSEVDTLQSAINRAQGQFISKSLSWFLICTASFSGGLLKFLSRKEAAWLLQNCGYETIELSYLRPSGGIESSSEWVELIEGLDVPIASWDDDEPDFEPTEWEEGLTAVQDAFVSNPDRVRLLNFLAQMAACGVPIEKIPMALLKTDRFHLSSERLWATVVTMTNQSLTEEQGVLLADAVPLMSLGADDYELLLRTLSKHIQRVKGLQSFAIRLDKILPPDLSPQVIRTLRTLHRRKASDFQDQGLRRRLGLVGLLEKSFANDARSGSAAP